MQTFPENRKASVFNTVASKSTEHYVSVKNCTKVHTVHGYHMSQIIKNIMLRFPHRG